MIYLDNAATTFPKPPEVPRAVFSFMREKAANPGRSGHRLSMEAAREVYLCRKAVAEMFGAPGPENVAFMMNATQAINAAMKGAICSGGGIVTSDLEHNAVMRPAMRLRAGGIAYVSARVDLSDDGATVRNFEDAVCGNVTMVACTHASNVCGKILPIKEIGEICRDRGLIFLVDASQSAGIVPIDMKECGIDFLCMPGHKGLYGPMGTGIMVTSGRVPLKTIIEGGTGSNSESFDQPDFMPDIMESGTVNAPGIAGLRSGIRFVSGRGEDELYRMERRLALRLYDGLSDIDGVRLYTPRPEDGYVPVVSFNIRGTQSSTVAEMLDKKGIALRGGLHCCPAAHKRFGTYPGGMVRASIGAFNTGKDISDLVSAVRKIAGLQRMAR